MRNLCGSAPLREDQISRKAAKAQRTPERRRLRERMRLRERVRERERLRERMRLREPMRGHRPFLDTHGARTYGEGVQVRVRYFAVVREKTGLDEETWALDAETTVAAFRLVMAAKYPELATLLPRIVVSVNCEYAKKDHVLRDGDEAALIPPIAGG